MRVETRYKATGGATKPRSIPRHVILIAETEEEQKQLDLLGNVAPAPVKIKGTMQLADGYGEMYIALEVPAAKEGE